MVEMARWCVLNILGSVGLPQHAPLVSVGLIPKFLSKKVSSNCFKAYGKAIHFNITTINIS